MSRRTKPRKRRGIVPAFTPQVEAGAPPGAAIYLGVLEPADAAFSLIQYGPSDATFATPSSVEEILAMLEEDRVNWINVNGFGDIEALKTLCGYLRVDPLSLEDILNVEHRPKVEDFGHYVLVVGKMIRNLPDDEIEYEQVSFILTRSVLVTFQARPGDCLGPVRERIKSGNAKLRRRGSSFLAYALLDIMVDNYFSVLESLGERLEEAESTIMEGRYNPAFMSVLQRTKAELNRMRRVVWPIRETVTALQRLDTDLLEDGLEPFLRDLHENTVQALEALETYRESAASIRDLYNSSISNRMNEIMKVLTIISTLFIPLTFIAGVYGMNFVHMPELDERWAYPAVWGLMALIAAGMLLYFKRKRWF
ncbi:MAG: magnesium/cobalt transporter CorA [Spirochaetales bacterium]|nr:magnesium/cobalt transporter CorA [Spirochaetales bacterium]